MAGAIPIRSPQWILTYQGVNITADISGMVTSIAYDDYLDGAAGGLEVRLEDHEKLWQGSWRPVQGDLVNLKIGYVGEQLLPCGDFQVDELSLDGPPDTLTLRGLSAYITPAMRTHNNIGYENQTLTQIVATIAAKYGYTAMFAGDVPNLKFARITQCQETDLAFLQRLARAHDYEFTVRGTQMVFYSRTTLEDTAPIVTIARNDLLRFVFRLTTHQIYRTAEVSYLASDLKRLLTYNTTQGTAVPTGDTLKIVARCENGQHAMFKATSALHRANLVRATASLTAGGASAYSAGNTCLITGFGFNDGKYLIESARHRLDRATGYTTEFEAYRVN